MSFSRERFVRYDRNNGAIGFRFGAPGRLSDLYARTAPGALVPDVLSAACAGGSVHRAQPYLSIWNKRPPKFARALMAVFDDSMFWAENLGLAAF